MQATPPNPTDRLSASLEAQQWNQVLALLQEGPYRVVGPILQSLLEQLNAPRPSDNVFSMEAS
jgi:hypothetical protein